MPTDTFPRDRQFIKFSAYGFLKNLRFFEPFLVLFFLEKGISYLEVGALYALREITVNILEIPTGAIADALGRRRTMVASFASYLVSFVVFLVGSSLPVFIVAMLFFSFGEAFRTGTHKAMIFTYLRLTGNERFKADYYGHTRGWSQIGSAVSAAIAAAIVFWSGSYAAVFAFSTIPYIGDLLLMLSYPAELDGERKPLSWSTVGKVFKELGAALVVTFRRPGSLRAVTSAAAYTGFYKGTKDYLQPLVAALALAIPLATRLEAAQREAVLIGLVYTLLYALTSIASRNAGKIARHAGSSRNAMNGLLLVGLAVGVAIGVTSVFSFTPLPVVPVVLFFLVYTIENMRKPVSVAVVAEVVEERVLATVLSVESQLQSVFAAITAFVAGGVANFLAQRADQLGLSVAAGSQGTSAGVATAAGADAAQLAEATVSAAAREGGGLSPASVGIGVAAAAALGLVLLPLLWIRRNEMRDGGDGETEQR